MDRISAIRSLLSTSKPTSPSKAAPSTDTPPDADAAAIQGLQAQYDAQTASLRDTHKAVRPKNTSKVYEPKQKEWEEWCAKLPGNTDGTWVTEDKLCLFLTQEVINRESRARGYEKRKEKRKQDWKEGEQVKKKARIGKGEAAALKGEGEGEGEGREGEEEAALDARFQETIRWASVNAYIAAVTDIHAWQFNGKPPPAPLRGAKLKSLIETVRRDEERVRRENFIDRGQFTIASGYDLKALKRAISWCWETASMPGAAVESYLRTAADHLLGMCLPLACFVCLFVCLFICLFAYLFTYIFTYLLPRP
jgi:hypothetical protein